MDRRLNPFQGWRLTALQAVIVAVFVLFGIRMYDLQVLSYPVYQAAADENRLNRLPLAAPRGVVFDRLGRPLARNVAALSVTIVPAELPDDPEEVLRIYNRLSALTGVPPTEAIAAASGQRLRSIESLVEEGRGIAPFRPVVVALDVDFHAALQIQQEQIELPGVTVRDDGVREYPTGALTAHIIGYMAPIPAEEALTLIEAGYDATFDRIGVDGVEFFLEGDIAGQRGALLREVDVAGETISQIERIEPQPGRNVRLTIDVDLQLASEEALKRWIATLNATERRLVSQQGVVMALNPQNGQILSMVSFPGYDNSRFARAIDVPYYLEVVEDPLRPLVNNAIRSLYSPGSVWKIVTAAGALEEGVIRAESTLFDAGSLVVENRYAPLDPAAAQTFVCWRRDGHGFVNMLEGIAQSCNVYFYQVGGGNQEVAEVTLRRGGLGIDDLFRYATAFGIGSEQGIELPGENRGRMPDRDWKRVRYGQNWSTGDTYNAALGQGYVDVTPMQLVQAAAVVANGGTLYQPTLIESFLDPEGNVIEPFQPKVLRNVTLDGVNGMPTLLMVEDMIMKGPASLACTCEPDSEWYNPVRCNPQDYRNTIDLTGDGSQVLEYRIHIPYNTVFNGTLCNPLRFDDRYRPAFVSRDNLAIIQEGMRAAVTVGTAQTADLDFVSVAGKTGTAQYCDNIASALGLCKFGAWPAHAWFVAYAPYEAPEIAVVAFIYNGTEGSRWAVPVATEVIEAYFRLKNERAGLAAPSAGVPPPVPTPVDAPLTGG